MASKSDAPDAGAQLLETAAKAYLAQDLASAAKHCDEVLAQAPGNAAALNLRAMIHLRADESGLAEARARRAVEIAPEQPSFQHTLAYAYRQQGRLDEAARHYDIALELDAGRLDSLLGLGAVQVLRGRLDEAKESFRRAVALRPDAAPAYYNLGRVHEDSGELEEAARCYRHALSLDPAQAHAWLNLGGVIAQLGDTSGAMAACRKALALRPDYAAAHNNLGTILQGGGNLDAAIESFREAIRLRPAYAEAHFNLGAALRQKGRAGEAAAALESALRLDPAHEGARFTLGALRGDNPPRPPMAVVRSLFDDYAPQFDLHLVDRLDYRIPERLAAEIAALRSPGPPLEVLDLGCGTGLFGAAVRPLASRITGVDLSPRMLEKARQRGGYDRLEPADILAFMRDEPPERYDLVAAADVFVYLGDLADVFGEVARVLRARGLFAFSVEALAAPSADGYRLQPTGRYAHDANYLRELALRHALAVRVLSDTVIRTEHDTRVAGWIAVLEK